MGVSASERNFSKMVLVDTAVKIMNGYKGLVDEGLRALQFLCHDQVRAALSVVHAASIPDPNVDGVISQVVDQTAAQVVKDTIDLIGDKITRLGREQKQLWIVLAANGFMKTKKDPSRKLEYMQEAVDKVTRPYYKIMACQEDALTAVWTDPPTGRLDVPNGILEYLPTSEQTKPTDSGADNATLLDFDAIAAWTFEDWSFNPADFPGFADPYQPQ